RDAPALPGNDTARWTIQSNDSTTFATPVHDHGIHGEGQTVTIADLGLDPNHSDFADPGVPVGPNHRKVTAYYTLCDPNNPNVPCGALGDDGCINHGTHVSGIVAGDDAIHGVYDPNVAGSTDEAGPHDGQAYLAKIQVQDLSGGGFAPPPNYMDLFFPAI